MNTSNFKNTHHTTLKALKKQYKVNPKHSAPIKRTVNIPLWAYCNEECFEIVNKTDFDKLFPFDKTSLLASSSIEIGDLLQMADTQKAQSLISLPKWYLDVNEELNLGFSYPRELLKSSQEEDGLFNLNNRNMYCNNDLQKKIMGYDQFESKGGLSITTNEKGKKKIESLELSTETKRLILEKYYRGKNHSDLKKVKAVDKVYSSLLYELFSKVYKERPIIEIEQVINEKEPNLQKYIARHMFNNELLSWGVGHSKKIAKCQASLKSLEIFAPSLIDEIEPQNIEDTSINISNQSNFDNLKLLEFNNKCGINENSLISRTPLKIPPCKFEESKIDKKSGLTQPGQLWDSWDQNPLAVTMPCRHTDGSGKGEIRTQSFVLDSDEEKPVQNSLEAIEDNQLLSNEDSDSEDNLEIELQQPLTSLTRDPVRLARISAIYEIYNSLLKLITNEDKTQINPLESKLESLQRLKFYCDNQVFSKLYCLHGLVNKNARQMPVVNCVQVGNIFKVYLHCPELNLNFCHHSESFETSVEMTKYQLIFAVYQKCKSIFNILHIVKKKFEEEKGKMIKKVTNHKYTNSTNSYKPINIKRPINWVSRQYPRFKNYNTGNHRNYRNKFSTYHQRGWHNPRNNSSEVIQKKIKVFG